MRNQPIDLDRILGAGRPFDHARLLGPTAIGAVRRVVGPPSPGTFDRVRLHSEKGCCKDHDAIRAAKKKRLD